MGHLHTSTVHGDHPYWRKKMKVIALATAAVLASSAAFAGNMAPMAADPAPMVEMEPEPAGSGALGWIIPIVAIAAIALASSD